jgi:hypothetical protein
MSDSVSYKETCKPRGHERHKSKSRHGRREKDKKGAMKQQEKKTCPQENDKSDWIQVKHKNSPKTKLTSPVNSITKQNEYSILSHSDDPIPDDEKI